MTPTLPPKVRNLTNIPHGNLTPVSYLRTESGRAVWSCLCQCGNPVERNIHDLRKGRRNGCDTCCPPPVRYVTASEKREAKRLRSAKYRAQERCGTAVDVNTIQRSKRAKARWGDVPEERKVSAKRAFVWQGKTVGEASNEAERAWLRRTFGDE